MSDKDDKNIQYRLRPDVVVERENGVATLSNTHGHFSITDKSLQVLFSVRVDAEPQAEAGPAAYPTNNRKRRKRD